MDIWLTDIWLTDIWLTDIWLTDIWQPDIWLQDIWQPDIGQTDIYKKDIGLADIWLTDIWQIDIWLADRHVINRHLVGIHLAEIPLPKRHFANTLVNWRSNVPIIWSRVFYTVCADQMSVSQMLFDQKTWNCWNHFNCLHKKWCRKGNHKMPYDNLTINALAGAP